MDKKEIRAEIRKKRDQFSSEAAKELSEKICNHLATFRDFHHVMVYLPFGNECNIESYINLLFEIGCSVYVPVCLEKGIMKASLIMDFENDLEIGLYGIRAPKKESYCFIEPEVLDAVIVPGVAFDFNGGRLGFGGGYYDRFLPKTTVECKKIAVCYEFQLLDDVFPEKHDFPMDIIITENAAYPMND